MIKTATTMNIGGDKAGSVAKFLKG